MKYFIGLIFVLIAKTTFSQEILPGGYMKGSLVLSDSTRVQGFIKDLMASRASVIFLQDPGSRKKEYKGQDLESLEIGDTKFICLHGDFFRVILDGELELFQKSSDASQIPSYNGNEAIFLKGTEGRIKDYFVYDTRNKQLNLVTRKNYKEVTGSIFNGYPPSMAITTETEADINQLKKAVELYNTRLNK